MKSRWQQRCLLPPRLHAGGLGVPRPRPFNCLPVLDLHGLLGQVLHGRPPWLKSDLPTACLPPTLQDLLGESFRRQMLMDGQFGQISFVCTKADNIM